MIAMAFIGCGAVVALGLFLLVSSLMAISGMYLFSQDFEPPLLVISIVGAALIWFGFHMMPFSFNIAWSIN